MNAIPHYKGLPLIGQAVKVLKDPLQFLTQLNESYKDLVSIKIAGKRYYLIQNPEICRHILQENVRNYYKPGLAKELKRFLGDGLATSNGEYWLRQRRLIQPAFHRKRIETLVDIIDGETRELINNWNKENLPVVKKVNQDFLKLTLANITKAMFGMDLDRNLASVTEVVNSLLEYATKRAVSLINIPHYIPTPSNLRFKKANLAFEKIMYEIIEKRKARGKLESTDNNFKDVLDILLHAYDDESQSYMTEQQLRDEIATIFMAGHETTAQTLSWIFYQIAAHPEIAEKLSKEADRYAGGEISLGDLQKMEYTRCVIEETLRVYPPVWIIVRRGREDDKINEGMSIPGGEIVLLNIYGLHHNAAIWKEPEAFRPERFSADNKASIPPFAYLPFGGGPRICIGNHFAMMVMQTVICRLMREFKFSLPVGYRAEVVPGVTLRAKHDIQIEVQRRN